MGVAQNERRGCFWQADLDEACGVPGRGAARGPPAGARHLRRDRRVRPPGPHPGAPGEHAGRRTGRRPAASAPTSARPGRWRRSTGTPCPFSFLQAGIDAMRAAGDTEFFDGVDKAEDLGMGVPDELISARVEDEEYIEAKMAAMRAHETQIAVDGPFFALSNNLGQRIWGVECFRLVGGTVFEARGCPGRPRVGPVRRSVNRRPASPIATVALPVLIGSAVGLVALGVPGRRGRVVPAGPHRRARGALAVRRGAGAAGDRSGRAQRRTARPEPARARRWSPPDGWSAFWSS